MNPLVLTLLIRAMINFSKIIGPEAGSNGRGLNGNNPEKHVVIHSNGNVKVCIRQVNGGQETFCQISSF